MRPGARCGRRDDARGGETRGETGRARATLGRHAPDSRRARRVGLAEAPPHLVQRARDLPSPTHALLALEPIEVRGAQALLRLTKMRTSWTCALLLVAAAVGQPPVGKRVGRKEAIDGSDPLFAAKQAALAKRGRGKTDMLAGGRAGGPPAGPKPGRSRPCKEDAMSLCADTVRTMVGKKGGARGPGADRRRLEENEDYPGGGGGGKRGRPAKGGGGGAPRRPPALAQCLQEHQAELSEACRESLEQTNGLR